MNLDVKKCSKCRFLNICKYKDPYEKLIRDIGRMSSSNYMSMFDCISFSCKYFEEDCENGQRNME